MMENSLSVLRNGIPNQDGNSVTSEEILNLVTNGSALQVNGNADDIYKILEKVPPEVIGELSKAIGIYIAKKGY